MNPDPIHELEQQQQQLETTRISQAVNGNRAQRRAYASTLKRHIRHLNRLEAKMMRDSIRD